MKKIYIAGPYTKGDVAVNVKKAMDVANDLMNLGFAPYCPHLTHFMHINNPQPYEKWLELDNQFVPACDALLRIAGESSGADKEVELAKSHGLPVFYSITEVVQLFDINI
jgi:hypothetical protein